jgi:hypothetical protein
MTLPTPENTTTEDRKRIPGLFRRWELPEIFEANCDYHIEDAGAHVDGTPLVALYSSGAQVHSGASSNPRPGDRLEIGGEAFLIQGEPMRDAERLIWTIDVHPA